MGPEGRRHIGARGPARVEAEYSLPVIAARYVDLYRNALVSSHEHPLPRQAQPCAE